MSGVAPDEPVFLLPEEDESAPLIGIMSARDGTAWFVVRKPGKCTLVQGATVKAVEVAPREPAPKPGYESIQRVILK